MGSASPVYPVALRVEGRRCLVVGGGRVAARKSGGLLSCGADVTLVAPVIDPAIVEQAHGGGAGPGSLTVRRRPYRPGEAAGFRLVVTATGIAEVDRAVAADADAAGVWVNSADDAEHCTFFLPSVHRDGPVSVAVSTGGASPALATWLRRRIAAELGPDLGVLAALLESARQRVKAAGRSTESVDWQALLNGPLPRLVRDGRLDRARELLEGPLPDLVPSAAVAGGPPCPG
ncbi:MAG TPA: bifunctional precorrin-2 dehydrogenase/sirohydrochlorin ferrochelatase [Acidimicrobiales bacterium]|nr:bifunctional precorrin-2 dehydrogenase/sirohydrochlorin ferrochelatase [Acidimicrobiales bacterium]